MKKNPKVLPNVLREQIIEVLTNLGPMTNKQIRSAIFGKDAADKVDPAGYETTKALGGLQKDGLVKLEGSPRRWTIA